MKTKKIIKELRQLNPGIGDFQLATEAANRLEMLSVEQKKLHMKLAAVKQERNALFADLQQCGSCSICKHSEKEMDETPCCYCNRIGKSREDHWEWRGAEDTNVLTKSATDINVGSKEE